MNFLAVNSDCANQLVLLEHRYLQQGPRPADVGQRPDVLSAAKIHRLFSDIGYVNGLLRSCGTIERAIRIWSYDRAAAQKFSKCRRYVMLRDRSKCTRLAKAQQAELGVTDPCGVFQHLLKHGLKLAGRRTDDLQYLRGCCLLF